MFEETTLLALKMEEVPRAKESRRLLEAGKGKKTDSPGESPEGTSPADTLILAQ